MEYLGGVAEGHVDRLEHGAHALLRARRRLHEEVKQRRLAPGAGDKPVAASAQSGQQRLGRERRQHRAHGCVDRVAAFA